jgi:hypothetical protein
MAADRPRSSTSSDSISLRTIRGRAPPSSSAGRMAGLSGETPQPSRRQHRSKGKARDDREEDEVDLLDDDAQAEHTSLLIAEERVRAHLSPCGRCSSSYCHYREKASLRLDRQRKPTRLPLQMTSPGQYLSRHQVYIILELTRPLLPTAEMLQTSSSLGFRPTSSAIKSTTLSHSFRSYFTSNSSSSSTCTSSSSRSASLCQSSASVFNFLQTSFP